MVDMKKIQKGEANAPFTHLHKNAAHSAIIVTSQIPQTVQLERRHIVVPYTGRAKGFKKYWQRPVTWNRVIRRATETTIPIRLTFRYVYNQRLHRTTCAQLEPEYWGRWNSGFILTGSTTRIR
jgi:hypothetical protein